MNDEPHYERSSPNLDRPRSSAAMASAIAVFVVLLAAGGATYYFLRRGAPPAVPAPNPAPSESAPAAAETPPAQRIQLPSLEASDDFLRQQLSGMDGDSWREWLTSDGLARRFAAAVYAVGEGKSPRRAIERPFLTGSFAVASSGGQTRIDPASYSRYDRIADTVAAIDAERAGAAYKLLRPLLDEAWAEIGPPGETFDAALLRAVNQLLDAPETPSGAEVYLQEGLYRYQDPALESATAAQKHLMRMGPTNAEKVKSALRRLRAQIR